MQNEIKGVKVPVTYMKRWDDEFCVRGWKLDCSIGEDSVIAATADTGARIATSVLVHDILDHHLCGVGIGGHRNEAIALVQLAQRTGGDPRLDYAQIVNEDLFIGHVNGESMMEFLPAELQRRVSPDAKKDIDIITDLVNQLGRERLEEILVEHFFSLGKAAEKHSLQEFESHGLDYTRRTAIGLCLQRILVKADSEMCKDDINIANGEFIVDNNQCGLIISSPVARVYADEVI